MFIEIDFPEVPQPCKGGMYDSRFLQGSVKNFTPPQDDLVQSRRLGRAVKDQEPSNLLGKPYFSMIRHANGYSETQQSNAAPMRMPWISNLHTYVELTL